MSGKVPPSSRAAKLANSRVGGAIERASLLYERFTGHSPEVIGKVRVPSIPKVVAVIGECDGVMYTTVRDGVKEKYMHRFRASDKPLLCTSPDGKTLMLIGGDYDFTELGIVDGSDTKHRTK